MITWENRALALLDKSLHPVPSELNELDWKSELSDKSDRIAQHISAFANQKGGGFIVFGINNNGNLLSLSKATIDEIITKVGNIARNNVVVPAAIEHIVINYLNSDILIIHIKEGSNKPVYLRSGSINDSYRRSAGQTRKMSIYEVRACIAESQNMSFEEQLTSYDIPGIEIFSLIDYDSYFQLTGKKLPEKTSAILDTLSNEEFIQKSSGNSWDITNLGAILFAKDLTQFKTLKRKAVRVIIYKGTNKIDAIKEQEGIKGYASGFEGLVKYIMDQLPTNEVIENALRKEVKMYPEKAVREFVANALIHQDFSITGTGVTIEIFTDRIEITNPGVPLVDTNRFIDTAPKSRNEALASTLRRLNICEERGSGVDRAVASIEAFQLPAPKFIREEDYTRIIMYAHKPLAKMAKEDRVRACYQHCCLQYVGNQITNNQSVRKRFNISEGNYPMASRIISDTIESGLIKLTDPESSSKKHATYIPFWA